MCPLASSQLDGLHCWLVDTFFTKILLVDFPLTQYAEVRVKMVLMHYVTLT